MGIRKLSFPTVLFVLCYLSGCANPPDPYLHSPPARPPVAKPTPPAPVAMPPSLPPDLPPIVPPVPPPPPAPPHHKTVATFPSASALAAVAYEDFSPSHNDEDFNDFLTDFRIFEKINSHNDITNIVVDFYPRAAGAWYDHQFILVLNGLRNSSTVKTKQLAPLINGPAKVTLTYYGPVGDKPTLGPIPEPPTQVTVFNSTYSLFAGGHKHAIINTYNNKPYRPAIVRARVSITLLDPAKNPINPNNAIDLSKFRMILHVDHKPYRDIDLINVDPTDFDLNRKDGHYYPFGFIIPVNWRWPAEGVPIADAYPSFRAYRDFLKARLTNPQLSAPESVMKWYDAPPVASKIYNNHGAPIPPPELLPPPW